MSWTWRPCRPHTMSIEAALQGVQTTASVQLLMNMTVSDSGIPSWSAVKKPLIRPMSPSGPTPFYADSPHGGDFFKRGNIDTVPALPITPPASQQKAPATPGAPAPVATTAGTPQAAAKPPTPKAPSRPPSPRKEFVYPPPVFAPA